MRRWGDEVIGRMGEMGRIGGRRFWGLDFGFWLLVIGHWSRVISQKTLDFGFDLFLLLPTPLTFSLSISSISPISSPPLPPLLPHPPLPAHPIPLPYSPFPTSLSCLEW